MAAAMKILLNRFVGSAGISDQHRKALLYDPVNSSSHVGVESDDSSGASYKDFDHSLLHK